MPWRELTLQVEAQLAEALSEALLEAGAVSVSIEQPDASRPRLHALVDLARDPAALVREAARAAGLAQPPQFAAQVLGDEDWVRKTQAQFAPLEIGARLWVGPTWHEPPQRRVAVRLDPGLAFGTGAHPSTRLTLEFLERHIGGGERVLDYGCGSGILAIAAAKLGAARVDGVDVDPQAVQTALANARANGIALAAGLPEALPAGLYDIVVSNILAQPLIVLAPLLAARSARGGRIALSGLLDSQAGEVAAAYKEWFDMGVDAVQEGWALLAGQRR